MTERADYRHHSQIATRWSDNDVYSHVNNVQYYSYFDTVINGYLIRAAALDFEAGPLIGVCAESHCKYISELAFPETIEAGLRVEHIGRSSVRYGLGLFRAGVAQAAAEGWFVHVFVDRISRRPAPLSPNLRTAFTAIAIPSAISSERPS